MTTASITAHASASPSKTAQHDNLLAAAHRTGHFKHLMAAVKAAGLADLLDGTGPFTVFAPNDRAFDRLARNELADLLKPENKARLTAILMLHVVSGHVKAASGSKPATLKSLQGEDLVIDPSEGGLRVNKARVVERDLEASNGVMHVIDTVLMPSLG